MKKTLLALAIAGLICSTTGCASGPLNQWFRGAPCNSCNPPIGATGNLNLAPPCDSGGCGTPKRGFFDWLRPQRTPQPASLPGGSFGNFSADPGVQYYGDSNAIVPPLEISPGPIGQGVIPQGGVINLPQNGIIEQGSIAPGSFLPSQAEIQQISPLVPTSGELYGSGIGSGIRSGIPPAIGPDGSGF